MILFSINHISGQHEPFCKLKIKDVFPNQKSQRSVCSLDVNDMNIINDVASCNYKTALCLKYDTSVTGCGFNIYSNYNISCFTEVCGDIITSNEICQFSLNSNYQGNYDVFQITFTFPLATSNLYYSKYQDWCYTHEYDVNTETKIYKTSLVISNIEITSIQYPLFNSTFYSVFSNGYYISTIDRNLLGFVNITKQGDIITISNPSWTKTFSTSIKLDCTVFDSKSEILEPGTSLNDNNSVIIGVVSGVSSSFLVLIIITLLRKYKRKIVILKKSVIDTNIDMRVNEIINLE